MSDLFALPVPRQVLLAAVTEHVIADKALAHAVSDDVVQVLLQRPQVVHPSLLGVSQVPAPPQV